jgi:hypothetical protein
MSKFCQNKEHKKAELKIQIKSLIFQIVFLVKTSLLVFRPFFVQSFITLRSENLLTTADPAYTGILWRFSVELDYLLQKP